MTEPEPPDVLAVLAAAHNNEPPSDWSRQGNIEVPFHEAMWKAYRHTLPPAPEAWRERTPQTIHYEYGNAR